MKKILLLPTVIALLIAILFAGACQKTDEPEPKDVTIYLKDITEEDGEPQLEMSDSNDTTKVVINTLITDVWPGFRAIWAPVDNSGILEIVQIGPKEPGGSIFIQDARPIPDTNRFMLEIPVDVEPEVEEEYYIHYIDTLGILRIIDPHLRVPPAAGGN